MTILSAMTASQKAEFQLAIDAAGGDQTARAASDTLKRLTRSNLIQSRSVTLANSNGTPNAAGGWRAGDPSAQIMTLDSTMRRRPGYDVTKIDASTLSSTASAFSKAYRKATFLVTTTGPIGIWLWAPQLSAGSFSAALRWSSDTPANDPPLAAATNYYELSFNNEAQQKGAWMFLSVSGSAGKIFGPSNANGISPTTTGAPVANSIKQLELVISWGVNTPSAERYVYIDHAEAGGKAKPMVVIGFDGYGDNPTSIANKLAKFDQYGLSGYVAGDGDSATVNFSAMRPFYDRGWDIITQGMNHLDYGANPGNLSADYDTAVGILRGLGFTRGLDQFAYPYNSRNAATDAILRTKGVRLGRTVLGNQRVPYNTTGTIDLLSTGAGDIDNRTAAQVQGWVDEAVASGSHLYLYGHGVNAAAGTSTNTNLTEFNGMMDYIGGLHLAGTIEVVTPTMFCDRLLA
jgi:peptidoglycan/xylan/chitin deacetylase (PgdA/CDA1 family)